MNETQKQLEWLAFGAGWDSYTLLKLICEWLEAEAKADALVLHLNELASKEE